VPYLVVKDVAAALAIFPGGLLNDPVPIKAGRVMRAGHAKHAQNRHCRFASRGR
jgi:hypothetical protein